MHRMEIFNRELTGMKNKLSRSCILDKVMQIVNDEVESESIRKRISTRLKRYFKDGNHRNMKLKFTNKISDIILTYEDIKSEEGARLEVALVDDLSEKTVDVGPEASARVEIVLLTGESDGDDEDFDDNIVPERRGKKPLLSGDVAIRLERGVGVVQNVKLRNHAIEIKPSMFKLGARVVDDFHVKEAKTDSFTVKDYRKKYHKKHHNPSLSDEVSRLCNIAKGGKIYERLRLNEIITVEDFLIRLLINCDELKNILNMGPKKWEATIKNARRCSSETRMYCYMNLEQKRGVIFNVLGQALGMYVQSHYSPMMEGHKACAEELLASAYKNWGDVKAFDDLDSLQQHVISCLSSPQENPLNPDCPGGGHETAKLIGETSGRHSNASFHSVSSAMNSVGGEDFSSFGTYDVDVETMNEDVMFSPLNLEAFFQDLEYFRLQKYGCNEQVVNESNADEHSSAVFAEAEVVQNSDSPKRWKILLSKWFSFNKRGSVDVGHHHKKQKIG